MYTEMIGHLAIPSSSSTQSLASAAVIQKSVVMEGCQAMRFMFYVAVATVGASTVVLKKRSAYGVTSGEVTLATLTIPAATAVGKIVYKEIESIKLEPGNELVVEVTSAATTGTGFSGVVLGHSTENAANCASMIASA